MAEKSFDTWPPWLCLIYSALVKKKSNFIVMTFLSRVLNVNFAEQAHFGVGWGQGGEGDSFVLNGKCNI